MHTVLRFQGLRRRSILVVLVASLLLTLVPATAFASSGGYYRQPRHAPQHQQVRRPAPQQHNYCAVSYKVRRGDTLSGIARHYRVSVRELAKTNRIGNPHRIYAGTTLCIPR